MNVDKKHWRLVNFRFLDKLDLTCSCAMFETYGILCKHILYVMKKKHVDTLPDHYIYLGGNLIVGTKLVMLVSESRKQNVKMRLVR